MKRLLAGLVLCAAAVPTAAAKPEGKADLILRGGSIYTLDAARSWADALAVAGGRIVYVGTSAGVERFVGPKTRVLDLNGKLVLPGLRDSHTHPLEGGLGLLVCDLSAATTQEQVEQRVREYAAAHPERPWVSGSGWALPIFPEAHPKKELLDTLVPDRPAFLWAADGHSAWANSKALAAAGIDRNTKDPPRGRIERDAQGEPTGALRELASNLVAAKVPAPTPAEQAEGLKRALELATSLGLVGLQDANVSDEALRAYAEADRKGLLSVRLNANLSTDAAAGEAQVDALVKKRAAHQGKRLTARSAKIFADGVIESHTAALLAPYLDRPAELGLPNYEPDALARLVTRLDLAGFQVHIHAIGDRAIRMSLDAFEAAEHANGRRDARHQLAHIQLFDPQDIPRFRRLGVIADFQGLWAWPDKYITELTEPQLGPERSRWLYPIASVARSGAQLAGGSDWPVSSFNPFEAIEIAVTRRGLGETEKPSWIPEERAELATMLAAYTIGGAYLAGEEQKSGSLEVGKSADLIVLDKNLFSLPPHEIHTAKVLLTLLEGQETFRDPGFATGAR